MRDGAARKPFLTLYQRESFRSNLAEIQFNSLDGGLNTRTQEKKKIDEVAEKSPQQQFKVTQQ
jgi:hypothetical protein